MGIHDEFLNKVVSHPEWDKIREELCGDESLDPAPRVVDLGGGLSMWYGECTWTPEQQAKQDLHMELCWWVNNGPGYCETAPESIKVYLRRLNIKV